MEEPVIQCATSTGEAQPCGFQMIRVCRDDEAFGGDALGPTPARLPSCSSLARKLRTTAE